MDFASGQLRPGAVGAVTISADLARDSQALSFHLGSYLGAGDVIDITLSDGTTVSRTLPGLFNSLFIGFVSDVPISTVRFLERTAPTLDVLGFAVRQPAPVDTPAPGGAAILLSLPLAYWRSRRSRP